MNATALNFWSLGSPGKGTRVDKEAVGAKRDKSGVGWWMQNPEAIFHGTSHDARLPLQRSFVPLPFNVPSPLFAPVR